MGKLEDSYIAFSAKDVAGLIARAAVIGDDVLWLILSDECHLRLPSDDTPLLPIRIDLGNIKILDSKLNSKVEIFELHDRVLREIRTCAADLSLGDMAEFGIVFNIDEEFQLRLYHLPYFFRGDPEVLFELNGILDIDGL